MTIKTIERVGERLTAQEKKQHFYRPLIEGEWKEPNVHFRFVYQPEKYSPEVQSAFNEEWTRVVENNPRAYSGPLTSLQAIGENKQGSLILEIGPTEYSNYRGSVKALSEEERTKLDYRLPNPLAAVLMIESSAGLLFAQRGEHLVHRPGGLYFPGGNVDFKVGGDRTIFDTARREVEEELKIREEEIEELTLRGVYYEEKDDAAPTALITARLHPNVDPQEILGRKGDGDSRGLWLPSDPDKLMEVVLDHIDNSLPIALAGVHNYLRRVDPDRADVFMQELIKRSI